MDGFLALARTKLLPSGVESCSRSTRAGGAPLTWGREGRPASPCVASGHQMHNGPGWMHRRVVRELVKV